MPCVLPVTPFHTNTFSDEASVEFKNKGCDNYNFEWLDIHHVRSGFTNGHKCTTTCRKESNSDSSISCRVKISNGIPTTVGILDVRYENDHVPVFNATNTENLVNGKQDVKNKTEMCNKTHGESELPSTTKHGHKRKPDSTESEKVYIPSKRVSPFLNTQKERKDERKKILKISVQKLKQVDDPETFLRRTVLVSNTMKRLQMELRAENLRTKNRKYFSGYRTLNNNCVSSSYLFDDPFLSGVHEKITDDMTDTLIYNVFHDTQNDRTKESDTEEIDSVK
ncbi:uncharacterized protein LOC123538177 [Mercenaria mercenaria]|uniref:uncharacterized protein LOC123538177 n=1 Tax=Mercenaria mercenaria TaxID=6596 RepID=UPI001E1D2B62|nr:uncharacterized protein LOC123538177 [Mercenaria mercenaria]